MWPALGYLWTLLKDFSYVFSFLSTLDALHCGMFRNVQQQKRPYLPEDEVNCQLDFLECLLCARKISDASDITIKVSATICLA